MKIIKGKRSIILFVTMILILIFAFSLSACINDDVDYANMKLESTSENGVPSLPRLIGYKSETSEFNLSNVTITIGLGDRFYDGITLEREHHNVPYIDLDCFSVSNYEAENHDDFVETSHYIKRINENFISEKFNITDDTDWFPYTEEITLPQKIFTGKYGYIFFRLLTDPTVKNGYNGAPLISSIKMYYKTDGTKVLLSNEEIKTMEVADDTKNK